MEKALELLKTYTWGDDRNALKPIDDAITASHGDQAARQQIEDKLIAVLKSDAGRNGKDYVCRKLKIVGTDASVSALASLLGDENHSHMARFALQSISTEAAGKALLDALGSVSGKLKAGVIGSLGARGDNSAVGALGGLLGNGDAVLAKSAAAALGAIRTSDAAKALGKNKPNPEATMDVINAQLACAESLLASGDKLAALNIYKSLNQGTPAKHVKLAATRGMLACAGK